MSLQIIVLSTSTQSDASFSISGVFWLVAPTNNKIPISKFESQVPFIDQLNLSALRSGALVEQTFISGLFSSGTVIADIQSSLQEQYSNAQSELNNSTLSLNNLVGTVFDGYSWGTTAIGLQEQNQKIQLNGNVITLYWTDFKTIVITSKSLNIQYINNFDSYNIFAIDNSIIYNCILIKTTYSSIFPFSSNYPQSQNDLDINDFETNYKSIANTNISPKSPDGRLVIRNTFANAAQHYKVKSFSFNPGDPTSTQSLNLDFSNSNDITITCYDVNGIITTNITDAIKTQVDWEPKYNYEIIGGWLDIPSSIINSTPKQWFACAIGVPDIPSTNGGNISFIDPIDLSLVYSGKIISDGRAVTALKYNSTYHTNKIRIIIQHPASVSNPRLQFCMEIFI